MNVILDNIEFIESIIGIAVGIVGIIVGVIGGKSLYTYNKNISKNQNIKKAYKSTITQSIVNGLDSCTVIRLSKDTVKEELKGVLDFEKSQELMKSDSHYRIPVMWFGTESEYKKLISDNKIYGDMTYIVTPDNKD